MLVHTSAASTDSNTVTSPAISTIGANVLVVIGAGTGVAEGDVTDSAGNSYASTTFAFTSASGVSMQSFVKASPVTSATHTVTITHTGAKPSVVFVALDGYTVFDNFTTATADFNLTSIQPALYTPGTANEIVMTSLLQLGAASGWSINGGFTIIETVTDTANATGQAAAYLITTGSPTSQPTWTWTTPVTAGAFLMGLEGTFTAPIPSSTGTPVWLYFGQSISLGDALATGLGFGFARSLIRNSPLSRRQFLGKGSRLIDDSN